MKRHSLYSSPATLPQFVRDLLASPPRRGEGLNNWFFKVSRVLHSFRDPLEIIELLRAATAGEPVKYGEIERAVERSAAVAWKPGERIAVIHAPLWPRVNAEQREAVIASGADLVDLWECSPVRFTDDGSHAEEIIDQLFPDNPLLCVAESNSQFATLNRESLRGRLSDMALIVPSPMSARTGHTQDGKESEHTLENTGPRRFLVIEQDSGSVDDQSAVLLHLAARAPLSLAVHSGSKSIHGWFYCEGQSEEKLRAFMRYAVSLGADRATWTRSQFVRLPGGTREDGNPQVVYFFNSKTIK
jgi:hypothetical protein